MTVETQSSSRLVLLHGIVFTVGFCCLFAGFVLARPQLLLVSGLCFVLTGALIWLGSRITFSGPLGYILRSVLNPTRLYSLQLRALTWVVAGILVTAWGIVALRDAQNHEPSPMQNPLLGERQQHPAEP